MAELIVVSTTPAGSILTNRLTNSLLKSFAIFNLNLVSVFTASKFALPYLRETKGNIINISSLVGTIGQLHATTTFIIAAPSEKHSSS